MTELDQFKRVGDRKKEIDGETVDVAIYQKGDFKIEVILNNIDHIVYITTSPSKWLNTYPVIPIGERDEEGMPIYKVIKLNERIARFNKSTLKIEK